MNDDFSAVQDEINNLAANVAFVASRRYDVGMDTDETVQSMIQRLVHEQTRATLHLEGLQRDVSTLLQFRDHVLLSLPRSQCTCWPMAPQAPAVSTLAPSAPSANRLTPASGHTWAHRHGQCGSSSLLDLSGRSAPAGSEPGATVLETCGASGASGASTSGVGTSVGASGDELMSLLETIEMRCQQLNTENRNLHHQQHQQWPPSTPLSSSHNCSADQQTVASDRTVTESHWQRQHSPFSHRPCCHHPPPSQRLETPAVTEFRARSAGIHTTSAPHSDEREAGVPSLRQVDQLLLERTNLIERLLNTELVAVRSQTQAFSLQSRLRTISSVNNQLRLHLASTEDPTSTPCTAPVTNTPATVPTVSRVASRLAVPRSYSHSSSPSLRHAGIRSAHSSSACDLRRVLPSRIPQPMSLRKRLASQTSPSSPAEQQSTRVECRSLTSTRRSMTPNCRVNTGDSDRPATPKVSTVLPSSQCHVLTQTECVQCEEMGCQTEGGEAGEERAVPSRQRVSEVLAMHEPLQLQKQLLLLLVEAESLRKKLNSSSRDWTQASHELTDKIASLQEHNAHLQSELDRLQNRCVSECDGNVISSPHMTPVRDKNIISSPSDRNTTSPSSDAPDTFCSRASSSVGTGVTTTSKSSAVTSIPVLVRCNSPAASVVSVTVSGATYKTNKSPTDYDAIYNKTAKMDSVRSESAVDEEAENNRKDWKTCFPNVATSTSSSALSSTTTSSAAAVTSVSASTGLSGKPSSAVMSASQTEAIGQLLTALSRRCHASSPLTPSQCNRCVETGLPTADEWETRETSLEPADSGSKPPQRLITGPTAKTRRGVSGNSPFGYKFVGSRSALSPAPRPYSRSDPALMAPNQGLIHQLITSGSAPSAVSTAVTSPVQSTVTSSAGGVKESGNARMGRYIRSLLHRISEGGDQQQQQHL